MADREERLELIRRLENERAGTRVITYLTSTRPNLEAQMAMDVVPIFYEHLRAIETPKEETRIDLFLSSNGGEGIVPWRLVTLMREFCSEFSVLVPHRAFSAATLLALGADRVIMHPMGMLGPTDPSVTTPFNPQNPQNPTQRLGISVEDVASYIALVKDDVGIRHEDQLIEAFAILARKIHPLALGSVKRATSQSRMLGEKLLKQRTGQELDEHDIEEITEKLTSSLYFHGHPINRKEAIHDLHLSFVESATPQVEDVMWDLFRAYSEEMRLDEEFQPAQEAFATSPINLPNPPAVLPQGVQPSIPAVSSVTLPPLKTAYIESQARADVSTIEFEVTVRREWTGAIGQEVFVRAAGWQRET